MIKIELAESMAGFLGRLHGTTDREKFHFEKWLFSPEGFFAVWDKWEKDWVESGDYWKWDFMSDVMAEIYYKKKDRYTALYTAINEIRLK